MRIIRDSSVIVSAIKPDEKFHLQSVEFLERVRQLGDEVLAPMTQLWEIGAALDHPGKTPRGSQFARLFGLELQFVTIDEGLFRRTWNLELRVPVTGADRVLLSCAIDKHAELISWDGVLLRNAPAFGVTAETPEAYLESHTRKS